MQKLPMRADWEHVITPVVDYLLTRPDVDSARVALYGGSFGGYLAPRAVAFEHRIAACIADAALFDPAALADKMFPPRSRTHWQRMTSQCSSHFSTNCNRTPPSDLFLDAACGCMAQPHRGNILRCFRRTHWPTWRKIFSVQRLCVRRKMIGDAAAARICTTLLQCPKEYVLFAASEGAGEHCEVGAREVLFQKMFGWLDPIMSR